MNLSKQHDSILNRGLRAASLCIVHCALCIALLSLISAANAAVTINNIAARQRWPWNGLVDVDFTISGAETGDTFAIDVDATAEGGTKLLSAKSFAEEPIATNGANRVVWDLAADYPGFKANDLTITVRATPFSDATPVYLVVDLSGGSSAASWPVRYTTTPPAHVQGATNEPCQTTELWLRRIPAGTDVLGEGDLTTSGYQHLPQHTVILTQPYYCAIFETTEKQYERMIGKYWGSSTNPNNSFRDARPVLKIHNTAIQGWVSGYPAVATTLNTKTGMAGCWGLPTEAQWEYAARAGTDGQIYGTLDEIARHSGNAASGQEGGGAAVVGSYLPNAWGLYDMIGNAAESVRDCFSTSYITKNYIYTNPYVAYSSATGYNYPVRGGHYGNSETYQKAPQREKKQNGNSYFSSCGFRVVMVVGGIRTDNISSQAPAE